MSSFLKQALPVFYVLVEIDMSKISVTSLVMKVDSGDCTLQLDSTNDGKEVYGLTLSDGREIYLYAEEIVATYQMLQRMKKLNSED